VESGVFRENFLRRSMAKLPFSGIELLEHPTFTSAN